jgi:hypothetical protein
MKFVADLSLSPTIMLSGRRRPCLVVFSFFATRGSQARDRRTGVESWIARCGAWLPSRLRMLPGIAVRHCLGRFGSINAYLLAFRLLSTFSTTLVYMRPVCCTPFLRKGPFRPQDLGRHKNRIPVPPLELHYKNWCDLAVPGRLEEQLTQ